MPETIKFGWLQDYDGNKFAPKSVSNKIYTPDGEILQDKLAGRNVAGENFNDVIAAAGAEIFNDLESNVATGEYSHAEGYNTIASGRCSHAQGSMSKAIGDYSFATNGGWAFGTHAISLGGYNWGDYSTSLSRAITFGDNSLSGGMFSMSIGDHSISLGASSLAAGVNSISLNNSSVLSLFENGISLTHTDNSLIYSYSENELFEKKFDNGPIFIANMSEESIAIAEVKSIDIDNKTITLSSSIGTNISNQTVLYYSDGISYGDYSFSALGGVSIGESSCSLGMGTRAHKDSSFVLGTYNKLDTNKEYIFTIGNGTDIDNRSNAHTINSIGEAWYAGDIYVGGTQQSEGAKVATIHIGSDTPPVSTLLWIDTSPDKGNGILKFKNGDSWIELSSIYT